MKIGVVKEIKNNENRVALTPAGVDRLVSQGHEVCVQATAGEGSGLSDDLYKKAGVLLQGLSSAAVVQPGLPGLGAPIDPQRDRLMKAVDALNHRLGRDAAAADRGADEIDEAIEHLWRAWGVVLALALGAVLI